MNGLILQSELSKIQKKLEKEQQIIVFYSEMLAGIDHPIHLGI